MGKNKDGRRSNKKTLERIHLINMESILLDHGYQRHRPRILRKIIG